MRYTVLLVLASWVISINAWADTKAEKIYDYISRSQQAVDAGLKLQREIKGEVAFNLLAVCVRSLMDASNHAMAHLQLSQMHSLVTDPEKVEKGRQILWPVINYWKYTASPNGQFCRSVVAKGLYPQLAQWLDLAGNILTEDPSQFE